ncbi:DNA ligase [Photobacterium swingsii]|uniref:DNA ligase n=1 Tax=Photobacterium swingsii TaxID=680026 RepID=A0A0J8VDA4_9GAMM|nr:zinc ribbon domain-containing protein [Photobacterium swingsii]KMV31261.1 DNA ligase [Photobacterium swingsii]PSW24105.1 DNA ligase [Photobacterium swingsii]
MKTENKCPCCHSELAWQANQYRCETCQTTLIKQAFCPDCDTELEKLQACGSASYFCNSCNELKSKSRVRIAFTTTK